MNKLIALLLLLMLLGCSGETKKTDSGSVSNTALANVTLDGAPVTIAGITFTPPSLWKDLGPSGMRQANYCYGPMEGEKDSATVALFFFGTGGGGINDNIERWIGQISLPDGGDPHTVAKREEFEVQGMKAHLVQLAGIYNASMGGPMSGSSVAKENYFMMAIVLEAPEGNLFFKLTGPEKTARTMATAFRAAIENVRKGEAS